MFRKSFGLTYFVLIYALFSRNGTDSLSASTMFNKLWEIVYEPSESTSSAQPPPYDQAAKMARYVVHYSDWCSIATISTREPIVGFPFANVFSLADGMNNVSTGIPYLYFTPLEMSVKDLKINNKASLTVSLAQGSYCSRHNYDPEDPRCAHIILTGYIKKIPLGSEEAKFAQKALFTRHPEMQEWPEGHLWFFAKLDVKNVIVLDYFGGAATVSVEEYFKASPYDISNEE